MGIDDIIVLLKVIKDINVILYELKDVDVDILREVCEKVRDRVDNSIVLFMSENNGKVIICVMVIKDVVVKGVYCGKLIKEVFVIFGGGGGGRLDMV